MRAAALAVAVLVAAGCGSSGKKYDAFTESIDFTVAESGISLDYSTAIENGDTTAVVRDVNAYVRLVEKYRRLGMSKKEAVAKLTKEANDLQDYCLECATILDRERENILSE